MLNAKKEDLLVVDHAMEHRLRKKSNSVKLESDANLPQYAKYLA
jgi:hypothetical protein